MKKTFIILLVFAAVGALMAETFLYTVELTPANMSEINPFQRARLVSIGEGKRAVLADKEPVWLDLDLEQCLDKEIVVKCRFKAKDQAAQGQKLRVSLRYTQNENYLGGPEGKSTVMPVTDGWQEISCSMKFPANMEEACLQLTPIQGATLVNDIRVYRK